jgi:hypothetical protein
MAGLKSVPYHRSPALPSAPRARRDGFLTIGVDFHGVLCEHPEGSKGLTEAAWPEVPGAIEWLKEVSETFNVHIVSARFSRDGQEGADAVSAARAWLIDRGVPSLWMTPVNGMPRIWLTPFKPACLLWVDDRGFQFRGRFPSAEEIRAFRPWNR